MLLSMSYWYVSDEKLDALYGALQSWVKLKDSIDVKVKVPWTGLELQSKKDATKEQIKRVSAVRKLIEQQDGIADYENLSKTECPTFVRFSGVGFRLIAEDRFWLATEQAGTALLLAGSAANAIGQYQGSHERPSPSADPIGAVDAAFGEYSGAQLKHEDSNKLPFRLSYIWQHIVRSREDGSLSLPTVQGIAVIAGQYRVHEAQLRRVGRQNVDRLIVGSPVWVEQPSVLTQSASNSAMQKRPNYQGDIYF